VQDFLEDANNVGAFAANVGEVLGDETGDEIAAFGGDLDEGAAMVVFVGYPTDKAGANGAVYEFPCAVMTQEHALGDVRDGTFTIRRYGGDDLKKLILLSRDASGLRGCLAEAEEAAKMVAEVGEIPDFSGRCPGRVVSFRGGHIPSSQYRS
jgi:hypothetical protein